MSDQPRILITGSAGQVGQALVSAFSDKYRLRGFDRVATANLQDAVVGDLTDLDRLVAATRGMDAVVHLGGSPRPSAPWPEVLNSNIIGTYNAFEAARRSGVRRFVYASRAGLLDGYPAKLTRGVDLLPRPTSYYSVGKCFGESLGYFYAAMQGLEVVSIRIGNFLAERAEPTHPHHIGCEDLVRVFERSIEHAGVRFEIVFGVSDSSYSLYDLEHGRRVLGFDPKQRSRWSPSRAVRALYRLLPW